MTRGSWAATHCRGSSDAACRSDKKSIELLIGAEVEQTLRIVDGAPVCEYIVRPQPVTLLDEAPQPDPLPTGARGLEETVKENG